MLPRVYTLTELNSFNNELHLSRKLNAVILNPQKNPDPIQIERCNQQVQSSQNLTFSFSEKKYRYFPGGTVGKNPPANAGDTFDPWSRKIPRDTKQPRLCATIAEPVLQSPQPQLLSLHALGPGLHKRSQYNQKPEHRLQRVVPPTKTLHAATKTQHSQK